MPGLRIGSLLLAGGLSVSGGPADRAPVVTATPAYPEKAIDARLEGDVTVCFEVDVDGRVRQPQIQHSTHRVFRRPAMAAIRESSFAPARRGQEAELNTCRTYRFRLERGEPPASG